MCFGFFFFFSEHWRLISFSFCFFLIWVWTMFKSNPSLCARGTWSCEKIEWREHTVGPYTTAAVYLYISNKNDINSGLICLRHAIGYKKRKKKKRRRQTNKQKSKTKMCIQINNRFETKTNLFAGNRLDQRGYVALHNQNSSSHTITLV